MADTIKTRAELITLFADNITNDISAQDLRDYLISVHLMTDLDQVVTVAKAGGQYTSIQSAINSISDAASGKIYTVLVYPGEYDESITLSDYIDIIAINPQSTKILQRVTDNEVECHCYINININSSSDEFYALSIGNANSVITFHGNITNVYSTILVDPGTLTIEGSISSSGSCSVNSFNGSLIIKNSIITCTYNNAGGHGIRIDGGTVVLRDVKIVCTHADAKSIYASSAKNAYCMNVWANRDDHANITQMITGGFNFDANVQ